MATDSLIQDIRYAMRGVRRAPLFAASVAGTIGLGLGILCSAFTIVNAYLVKPIDLPKPHELYALGWATATDPSRQSTIDEVNALAESPSPLSGLAARTTAVAMYNGRPLTGQIVTGNYLNVIGAAMLLGRPLLPEDAPAPGARAVVVLSHEAWRAQFGSDRDIVGREITLSGQRFTVLGVTRPGQLLPADDNLGFWAPLTMARAFQAADPLQDDVTPALSVVGRLRAGATEAELRAWFETWLRQRFPPGTEAAPQRVSVRSLATRIPLTRGTTLLFSVLVSVFGVVLVVACANVMNMMLARGLSRQRELGVRLSLGATRARVVRQLIIESLALAVPAAAVGLALTLVTARLFPVWLLGALPQGTHISSLYIAPLDPDARVVALLAMAAIAGAILVGLSPALQVTGPISCWPHAASLGRKPACHACARCSSGGRLPPRYCASSAPLDLPAKRPTWQAPTPVSISRASSTSASRAITTRRSRDDWTRTPQLSVSRSSRTPRSPASLVRCASSLPDPVCRSKNRRRTWLPRQSIFRC